MLVFLCHFTYNVKKKIFVNKERGEEQMQMTILKRSLISILRKPVKSIILLLLIFILGVIISGSISAHQAINITEANMRRSMRPIVTLYEDFDVLVAYYESTGEWPEIESMSPELIRQVGDLPYVSHFDYSIIFSLMQDGFQEVWVQARSDELVYEGWGSEGVLHMRGTSHVEPMDFREELVELVEGQFFTEEQIQNAEQVVIISRQYAELNYLTMGSIFPLENGDIERDFEIIGLYEVISPPYLTGEALEAEALRVTNTINRLYLPNDVGKDIHAEMWGSWDYDITEFEIPYMMQNLFVLSDPLYLDRFTEAALEVLPTLPDFWVFDSLVSDFDTVAASMQSIQQIADWMLIATFIASIIILTLTIFLFLRDQRHQIGIYLALGERKHKIISQIMLETLPLAIIGLTLSIFAGNMIAESITHNMLRNEFANYESGRDIWGRAEGANSLFLMGFAEGVPTEEMLAEFSTSLDTQTVIIFYVIGLGVVMISTVIPVVYALRLKPKEILL